MKGIAKLLLSLVWACLWIALMWALMGVYGEMKGCFASGSSDIWYNLLGCLSLEARRSIGGKCLAIAACAVLIEPLQERYLKPLLLALIPNFIKKIFEKDKKKKSKKWYAHFFGVLGTVLAISFVFPYIFRAFFFVSVKVPDFETKPIKDQLELLALYGNQFSALASIFSGLAFGMLVLTLTYTIRTDRLKEKDEREMRKKRDERWITEQKRLVASEKRNEFYRRITLAKGLENSMSITTLSGVQKMGSDAAFEFVNYQRAFMDELRKDEKSRNYEKLYKVYNVLSYSHWSIRMWINTVVNIVNDIKRDRSEENVFYLNFLKNSTNHFSKLLLLMISDPIGCEQKNKIAVDELVKEQFILQKRYGWIVGSQLRILYFNTLLCT